MRLEYSRIASRYRLYEVHPTPPHTHAWRAIEDLLIARIIMSAARTQPKDESNYSLIYEQQSQLYIGGMSRKQRYAHELLEYNQNM